MTSKKPRKIRYDKLTDTPMNFSIRITKTEYESFKAAARRLGVSIASFMRQASRERIYQMVEDEKNKEMEKETKRRQILLGLKT